MKKKIAGSVFVIVMIIATCFPFCDVPDFSDLGKPNKITLIWNKSYEGQTRKDVNRGLIWTLSWLGAELPAGSFDRAIESTDSTILTLNLDSVGFSEDACSALRVICDSIRRSEEYKAQNGIDVGKFVMLTLGSSWHYYRITGAPTTLKEFRDYYHIDTTAYLFGVTKSTIAEGHRKIYFSRDTALFHCGFMAEEGDGSLDSGTFRPTLYECFDIMPNGQLRFMIFNKDGWLTDGTPALVGDAGKPTKCLWCHETHVQALFIENHAVNGMLSNEEFLAIRDSFQVRLDRYRLTLSTDMNWKNQSDHTLSELLYITFMEPTVMHLTHEWGMGEADVLKRIKQSDHHRFEEFDYIGEVYGRQAIDRLDTLVNLEVPTDARETMFEVNYFR